MHPLATFGPNKVSIPTRYYKAVLDVNGERAIGFLFRNNVASGAPKSFAVSVDELEKITGLDFFPSLPDEPGAGGGKQHGFFEMEF